MKKKCTLIAAAMLLIFKLQAQVASIEKIWDNGLHNAFPSVIEYKGKYYCSFREGESHIFDKDGNAYGKVRIIVSTDGKKWESAALFGKDKYDLRDPKLSVTPDGKLMVIIGGSIYANKELKARNPQVSFSSDGKTFTPPVDANIDPQVKSGMDWLWRITWDGDTGYVVNYSLIDKDNTKLQLLKTTNGIDYMLVASLGIPLFPNETTVRIMPDKEMLMLVRQERGDTYAHWGRSYPPYTKWEFTSIPSRLGGPDFLALDDNLFVVGSRCHGIYNNPFTLLSTADRGGKLTAKYVLPSGGDNSYPGFLIVKDELWVCYYSSHESSYANIYLAKFPLDFFK